MTTLPDLARCTKCGRTYTWVGEWFAKFMRGETPRDPYLPQVSEGGRHHGQYRGPTCGGAIKLTELGRAELFSRIELERRRAGP